MACYGPEKNRVIRALAEYTRLAHGLYEASTLQEKSVELSWRQDTSRSNKYRKRSSPSASTPQQRVWSPNSGNASPVDFNNGVQGFNNGVPGFNANAMMPNNCQ